MNDQNINHAHGLIGALRRREALEIDCAREAREDGKHALAKQQHTTYCCQIEDNDLIANLLGRESSPVNDVY